MEVIMSWWNWLLANGPQIGIVLTALVALGEAIVKLTPTESDDGFVTRIGLIIDKILSFIPGAKKP